MFDPFLYVPLPIPPPKIKYEVIFFARDKPTGMCKGSTSYTIKLPHSSTVSELLNIISAKTNVSTKSVILFNFTIFFLYGFIILDATNSTTRGTYAS